MHSCPWTHLEQNVLLMDITGGGMGRQGFQLKTPYFLPTAKPLFEIVLDANSFTANIPTMTDHFEHLHICMRGAAK